MRIGFAGGGTDLREFYSKFGGLVVNSTIDMYVYARITPLEEGGVHFVSHDTKEEIKLRSDESYEKIKESESPENMPLFFSSYRKIMSIVGTVRPHRLETCSDSPVGSGLGTSSSLCVAILKAYDEWLDLGLTKNMIASMAYEVERIDCGFEGGVQDQYAATFGGLNKIQIETNGEVTVENLNCSRDFRRTLESMTILHYSGRSRESGRIISDQIDSVAMSEDSLKSMKMMKNLAESMASAISEEDILRVPEIISQSWEEKKNTSDKISNEGIEKIIKVARESGAIASKVSGAGGGGHILFMVPFENRNTLLRSLNYESTNARVCSFTEGGVESWKMTR